jgi:ABC-type multidrug transport system fused ATPase/permease subunit
MTGLDIGSAAKVREALSRLMAGKTCLVITHDPRAAADADVVLVLEDGQIVERGTHPELLARDGRYRQLYDKQYNFERDRFINPGEDFTPEPEEPAVPVPPIAPPTRL